MKNPPPMYWVIGLGYLGSRLAQSMRAQGHAVLGIDIAAHADAQGDAADASFLSRLPQPERIFFTQATKGGDARAYEHSYRGVIQAVESVAPEARGIFCSSSSLYGERTGARVNEQSPLLATSEKSQILQACEERILQAGGSVARLAALYGRGRSVLLPRYQAGMVPIAGPATRWLNYVHVDDVVSALHLLAEAPARLYNISSESLQKGDLLALIAEVCALPPALQEPEATRRGMSNQQVEAQRLRQLGWCPKHQLRTFLEGEWSLRES